MPRTDCLLAEFGHVQWFTSLDISQEYFQVPVWDENVTKTTYICHRETFEFSRMAFEIPGGPAPFQKHIDEALAAPTRKFCMTFSDEVLMHWSSLEDHWPLQDVLIQLTAVASTINHDTDWTSTTHFFKSYLELGFPGDVPIWKIVPVTVSATSTISI